MTIISSLKYLHPVPDYQPLGFWLNPDFCNSSSFFITNFSEIRFSLKLALLIF